jgi:signal transduction histidine kinase
MSDFSAGRELELQPGSSFYHDINLEVTGPDEPPAWLNQLDSGFHEVFREGQAFHALVYRQGDERFLFLRDQTVFERREQALFLIVAGGFVLSVAAAWILGYLLARRIMEPVVRLAQQVSHRDQLRALAPTLAPDYADDEVGQLAAAFDQTLADLRDTLERERLFTSDVSHELRTPLTVISTASELLLATPGLSDKQVNQLQRIRRASEDMRHLVRTFLLLARDRPAGPLEESANGSSGDNELATLDAIAREQFQQWRPAAEAKGLVLQYSPASAADKPCDSVYNASLLRAVISNLLRNAIHYTDAGEVVLVTETDAFRVEDTGRGIEAGEQQAVFQPFFRGKNARGEGLGLGLSLVRRICVHQGWAISLQPQLPRGSCFRVELHPAA